MRLHRCVAECRTVRAAFSGCTFTGTELYSTDHRGTSFVNCTFDRAAWHSSRLVDCRLTGSVFVDCRFVPIVITDCDLTLVSLGGATLVGTDLAGLRLREANLTEADLSRCDLRGADLTGARATGLRLTGADLRGARIDPGAWVAANLTGARVDVDQAVLYAAAHGLVLRADDDSAEP